MNIYIVILSTIILIMFIFFFVYVYTNRESDASLELFGKVLIAVMAAFVIIGIDVLKPIQNDSKRIQILILKNKEGWNTQEIADRLLKVSSFYNGYQTISDISLFTKKKENFIIPKAETATVDLVEMAFWCWLSKKYTTHWDIKDIAFEGISGGGGSSQSDENAEPNPTCVKIDQMRKLLSHNSRELNQGSFFKIHLPSNTSIDLIQHSVSFRRYLISNKYFKLDITISYIGNAGVFGSILGNKMLESLKKFSSDQDYYTNDIIVDLNCSYSLWYKGNPEFLRQKKWINNLMDDAYKNFDWSEIRPKLEKAYGIN